MKKNVTLFLAFIAVIAIAASCKKSSSSPGYHLTATIDGTAKTFNISPYAVKQTNGGAMKIGIIGVASTSTGESLEIDLANNAGTTYPAIVAGTYADTSTVFDVEAYYTPTLTTEYDAGNTLAQEGVNTVTTYANHFKLVITSIDSVSIKGTFSGDFYFNGDLSAAKKSFTNGDFYAKFQ